MKLIILYRIEYKYEVISYNIVIKENILLRY